MADDVIEDAGQVSDDEPQAEVAAPDESEDIVAEDATGDEEFVDSEVMAEGDDETEQPRLTRDELREQYAEELEIERNAAAQSAIAKLRSESSNREATADRVKGIKARLAEVPEGDDAGLNFLYDNAKAHGAYENLQEMTAYWAKAFDPTPEERETLNKAASNGPEAYAAVLLNTASRSLGSNQVYEMDIADIPADSNLARSALTAAERQLENEQMAQTRETTPKKRPAPSTPAGSAAGAGTYDDPSWVRDQMTKNPEWANQMSPDGKRTNLAAAQTAIDLVVAMAKDR